MSCNRSVHSQPASGGAALRDGDCRIHQGGDTGLKVGHIYWHKRRLCPRPHVSSSEAVPAFLCQQTYVPIHVPPVQACYIPAGVHQAPETSGTSFASARNRPSCLFGRLVNPYGFTTDGQCPCPAGNQGATPFGMDDQLSEIRTNPRFPINRHAFQSSGFHRGPSTENVVKNQAILNHWRWTTTVSALDVHRMSGTIHYMAPLVPPTNSVVGPHRLGPVLRGLRSMDLCPGLGHMSTCLVGIPGCLPGLVA